MQASRARYQYSPLMALESRFSRTLVPSPPLLLRVSVSAMTASHSRGLFPRSRSDGWLNQVVWASAGTHRQVHAAGHPGAGPEHHEARAGPGPVRRLGDVLVDRRVEVVAATVGASSWAAVVRGR